MHVLITLRDYNSKIVSSKIENLIKSFKKKKYLNIGIAIDARGGNFLLSEIDSLNKKYTNTSIKIIKGSSPGKSSAQREFAEKYLNDNDFVLLNDLNCNLKINKNFDKNFFTKLKCDCVIFPVIFNSKKGGSNYFQFENFLRKKESKLKCCFTGSGQVLGVRAKVLKKLPNDVGDDCFLPLYSLIYENGTKYSSVITGLDIGYESPGKHFAARKRMFLRNFPYTFISLIRCLYKLKLFLALIIFFHKVLRWTLIIIFPIFIILLIFYIFSNFTIQNILFIPIFALIVLKPKFRNIFASSLGTLLGFFLFILGRRITHY